MSKRTIFEAPGVEVYERETFHPVEGAASPLTTVRLELEVGGWQYDVQPDDVFGIGAMLKTVNELQTSLGRLKMELRTRMKHQA